MLCFSALWTTFRSFLADESGYAQPREGLGLGWVAGALVVLAVLAQPRAAAANPDFCAQLAPGECDWFCVKDDICGYRTEWQEEWCKTGSGNCVYMGRRCSYDECPVG